MEINQEEIYSKDIIERIKDLFHQKFLSRQDTINELFQELSLMEYVLMSMTYKISINDDCNENKVYLSTIANAMRLRVNQTSKMIKPLKDRGLLVWEHDGDGSDGTYIALTEYGLNCLHKQDQVLQELYERVIAKYGVDNAFMLLQLVQKLDQAIEEVIEVKEVSASEKR